jgi:ASTRA-associated protein 1
MSSSLSSAPPPLHIIRSHGPAISSLFISSDNERIYSGDISGLVVITSTRSFRPLASWKAHTDGLLGVEEWGKQAITSVCDSPLFRCPCTLTRFPCLVSCPLKSHGRDNKLHVWKLRLQTPSAVGGSALAPGILTVELNYSLDVNALNFCRFSLLRLDMSPSAADDMRALVAVPNLVESSLASASPLCSRSSNVVCDDEHF